MENDSIQDLISRTIEGVEALVGTESGEIFVDVPVDTPQYVRVREGDLVQEGDIRSETAGDLESASLEKWTVESIGADTVVGTDRKTGDRHEWTREELERKLASGALSTNLTGFERANVVGSEHDTPTDKSGDNSITVAVYGDDGRKFTRTYRPDKEGDGRNLELVDPDERVDEFDPELRAEFDRTVAGALEDEGYAV